MVKKVNGKAKEADRGLTRCLSLCLEVDEWNRVYCSCLASILTLGHTWLLSSELEHDAGS